VYTASYKNEAVFGELRPAVFEDYKRRISRTSEYDPLERGNCDYQWVDSTTEEKIR